MQFEAGTYVGNGTSQNISLNEITGVPDLIITQDLTTPRFMKFRMTGMTDSQRISHANTSATGITALGTGQFSVGSDADCNTSLENYIYIAFKDDGNSDFIVGSYTGDGGASKDINTGLGALECVWVFEDASAAAWFHTLSMGGTTDLSADFNNTGLAAGYITDIATTSGHFIVGSSLNTSATPYYYVAFASTSGFIDSISYTGDATDDRNIDVDPNNQGNTPEFCMVVDQTTARTMWWRTEESGRGMSGDYCDSVGDHGATNRIQAFSAETVQVGSHVDVNNSGDTYHIFWLVSNPVGGGGSGVVPVITNTINQQQAT